MLQVNMSVQQNCSMCAFFTRNTGTLINHLLRRHKYESNFIIHCSGLGCGASFSKIGSFRKHVYRKHCEEIVDNDEEEDGSFAQNDTVGIAEDTSLDTERDKRNSEAHYLLKLQADHNLSQRAIDDIICSTRHIVSMELQSSIAAVQELNSENRTNFDFDNLTNTNVFQGLETDYMREKYFEKHLGYVKPMAIKLGEERVYKKIGTKHRFIEREVLGYYVPFIVQLKEILKTPEVKEALLMECSSHFELCNIQDGAYFQKQFFKEHPDALLFGIYHDDFEIVNPIGSHRKKHKLSVFYWSLLNIESDVRFKMQAIQLLAVAKSKDVRKYDGLKNLLKDFLESMNQLHQGIKLETCSSDKTFGALVCAFGDTPAAQLLGGFKEGVGVAEKPCRSCYVSFHDVDNSFCEDYFNIRNLKEYNDQCEALESITGQTRKYWSKQYGITKRSILNDVPTFDVTKCILHDPMHVLLEGIVKLELQLLLTHLIEKKKVLTLHHLNNVIKDFPYGKHEFSDKPQQIERKHLDRSNTFPMTAVETKNFMILLPFMIGSEIDGSDEMWINFIRLLKITLLIISPVASEETMETLRQLIFTHNHWFSKLYPDVAFTPKLHYLIHFPSQILRFGPGRNHWCLRLEAKHSLFKNKKWRNFKSLPLSVAVHHQRWMCLQQTGGKEGKSEVYLYRGDEVSNGLSIPIMELHQTTRDLLQSHCESDIIFQSNSVKIRGLLYTPGSVVVNDVLDGEPNFCVIKRIFVLNNIKYFECAKLEILQFEATFNAFACNTTNDILSFPANSLKYKWPQLNHTIDGQLYVMLQNVDFCWM